MRGVGAGRGNNDSDHDVGMTMRRSKRHDLKTWLPYFDAVADGDKRFEVRLNDRDYQAGDWLRLLPFDPTKNKIVRRRGYRHIDCEVRYVLPGGQFGIDPKYVIMSIDPNME